MPYELTFTKRVPITDRDRYINDCCIGGDVVVERLLPAVRTRYDNVRTGQEDWGWFIWFRKSDVKLAIDLFTDDPGTGAFRIHLTSRVKRMVVVDKIVDTPELDELRAFVTTELSSWVESPIVVETLEG